MLELSREERLLLLACTPDAGGETDARLAALVRDEPDWAFILWRAETYQTLPLLRHHLERLGLLDSVPVLVSNYLAGWTALSRARSRAQYRELGVLLAALRDAGIDHYLMKGAAIAALAYPDPLLRPMQDLDIMIRPEDAWRVQRLVYALGYRHGVFVPATGRFHHLFRRITRRSLRGKHALHSVTKVCSVPPPVPPERVPDAWRARQLKSAFAPDGSFRIPVFVDFHVSLSAGMALADVWRGAVAADILGQRVIVQSPTAMVWFSAARLYLEAFERNTLKLQMLGDLDALLKRCGDAVDWAELLTIADRYGLRPALFYVLGQLRESFGAPVPEAVLALLMPDPRAPPLPADFGDIAPKLLSRPVLNRLALA